MNSTTKTQTPEEALKRLMLTFQPFTPVPRIAHRDDLKSAVERYLGNRLHDLLLVLMRDTERKRKGFDIVTDTWQHIVCEDNKSPHISFWSSTLVLRFRPDEDEFEICDIYALADSEKAIVSLGMSLG